VIDEVVVSTTDLQARLDQWVKPSSLRYAKQEGGAASFPMRARPDLPDSYDAPRNRIEQTLLGLWQELLGIEDIGIRDDFFELGGQSLLATQLISRARASFGVDLPLRAFFTTPTIAGLSDKIVEAMIAESDSSRIDGLLDLFEMSEGQSRNSPGIDGSFN
jgi:acyl carrier protein